MADANTTSTTTANTPGKVSEHLNALRGQPVRITLFDAAGERSARLHGVLAAVHETELTVECVDSVAAMPEGTLMTVEALVRGMQTWFDTRLVTGVRRSGSKLQLRVPEKLQTAQRRLHPRIDYEAPLHLVVKRTGQVIRGVLRDLSAGGASVRLASPVPPGETVQLVFNLGSGLFFENLEGDLLRLSTLPDGSAVVGLQFRISTEQQALLAQWVNQRLTS